MSSMTLYRETPCKHGETKPHEQPPHPEAHLSDTVWCPGGSREEVTFDQLEFMVANACASLDMQSGPFDMLAELNEEVAASYRRFAKKHVDFLLSE